jgi:hypothetical protein
MADGLNFSADFRKTVKNSGPEDQALVIHRGDLICWKFKNYKYQITNIKQITMTEIRNSKQCFVLKGLGHAQRRRLRRVLNTRPVKLRLKADPRKARDLTG